MGSDATQVAPAGGRPRLGVVSQVSRVVGRVPGIVTQVGTVVPGRRLGHAGQDGAVDVTETLLPGVGIRYEIVLASGERVGLVAHRDGTFDLVAYSDSDPDACTGLLSLSQSEADTLAELMGAPRIAERFADLTKEIPGLVAAQIEIPPDSLYAGHTLGDTRARTLTGASVVAVVRNEAVIASPGPDTELAQGDVLVVIGTEAGINGVRRIVGA